MEFLKNDEEVGAHRREKVGKLAYFETFEAAGVLEVPDGIRFFDHCWVDAAKILRSLGLLCKMWKSLGRTRWWRRVVLYLRRCLMV